MKKKVLKIIALVVAVALIVGVCIFANALVGNPISKWVATNTAEKHLEDSYGEKDFEIELVLPRARTPIIKMVDKETNIHIDLSYYCIL